MLERGDAGARFRRGGKIDIGKDNARLLAAFRQDLAPGRNDQAVAEGGAAVLVQATLGCSEHERAGLDRAGADQNVPMRLPGLLGEGGGDGDELGAGKRECAVESGEAEIVADRESQAAEGKLGNDSGSARPGVIGFAVALAIGKIDIEQMQLVVTRRDLPLRIDEIGAVGDTSPDEPDGERADMKKNAELRSERAEPCKRRARLLGLCRFEYALGLELHQRGILWCLHIGGAAFRRAADERLGAPRIGIGVAAGTKLHQCGAETFFGCEGHDSLPASNAGSLAIKASSLPSRSSAASSAWPPTWRLSMKICGTVRIPAVRPTISPHFSSSKATSISWKASPLSARRRLVARQ